MSYQAPIKDMLFAIRELAGLDQVRLEVLNPRAALPVPPESVPRP
jgi:hypothetical protein